MSDIEAQMVETLDAEKRRADTAEEARDALRDQVRNLGKEPVA